MIITPEIDAFAQERARLNCRMDMEVYTSDDVQEEYAHILNNFHDYAEGDYCPDCFGLGDGHYLDCPVWLVYRALTK